MLNKRFLVAHVPYIIYRCNKYFTLAILITFFRCCNFVYDFYGGNTCTTNFILVIGRLFKRCKLYFFKFLFLLNQSIKNMQTELNILTSHILTSCRRRRQDINNKVILSTQIRISTIAIYERLHSKTTKDNISKSS